MTVHFCKHCGRLNLADFVYCPYCGREVEARAETGLAGLIEKPFDRLEKAAPGPREKALDDFERLARELDGLERDIEELIISESAADR